MVTAFDIRYSTIGASTIVDASLRRQSSNGPKKGRSTDLNMSSVKFTLGLLRHQPKLVGTYQGKVAVKMYDA